MKVFKNLWKGKAFRVWLITAFSVIALFLAVTILASTLFFELICIPFGGKRVNYLNPESIAFKSDFTTKAEAEENGDRVTYETCLEGFTLLKNSAVDGANALPLDSGDKISVFGKNSVNLVYGGSGSSGGDSSKAVTLEKSLTDAGFQVNPALTAFYKDDSKSGKGRSDNPSDLSSGAPVKMENLSVGETPQSMYTAAVKDSYKDYSDVAVIVISRIGGEGFDLPRSETTHYLKLDENEQALVEAVASNEVFKKVVVLVNTATTFELGTLQNDSRIDAIMWIGMPGNNGIAALGELLAGKTASGESVGPSGHTVDIWAADFTKDPTWENFGGSAWSDAYTENGKDQLFYFVDYEEGVYVGYRYYETAYAEQKEGNYAGFDYEKAVVYPFGYGLSYASFDWELNSSASEIPTVLNKNSAIKAVVKVTNNSSFYGREVVELYVTAPHSHGENAIEKPHKLLVGFAKTKNLAPGESEEVTIEVDSPYAFASFTSSGYVAEAGEYTFTLASDSHADGETHGKAITFGANIESDIAYKEGLTEGSEVKELFSDADDELGSVLSRKDFKGTWPAHRTDEERQKEVGWVKATRTNYSTNNPNEYTEMPALGVDLGENKISFQEMKGAAFDDPRWESFLSQLTFAELLDIFNNGAFKTEGVQRLFIPQTTASDGTTGFANFMGSPVIYNTCVYCCEMVTASTWNTERAKDIGLAEGNEGCIGNAVGDTSPYSGLYAPGINLHRSPFGGRNFEYYSEDPLLSGYMAAAQIKGAAEKGLYYDMKHFALNEQETHRSINGVTTWATEQSIREVYLKAFELAIKNSDGKAMGVMSSFNRIGLVWTGGDYRLLTTVLREEWGFNGIVICDFNTNPYMDMAQMAYAGGSLNLQTVRAWTSPAENAMNATVLKDCAKNVLYVVANSNAMRGEFTVSLPLWQTLMYVFDALLLVGLCVWGALVIIKLLKKDKENPLS